jgi:HSP20 family protein
MIGNTSQKSTPQKTEELWNLHEEGQLAVDVAETPTEIIIRTAIAGVTEKELDIHITDDLISIHGTRQQESLPAHATLHYSECFWGSFSRAIILPCHIKTDEAEATLKNGVLTIHAPKARERVKLTITKGL